jgi:hypothetical protein
MFRRVSSRDVLEIDSSRLNDAEVLSRMVAGLLLDTNTGRGAWNAAGIEQGEAFAKPHTGDASRGLSGALLVAHEGLRIAGVLALCGTYVSIVALLTAGGVVSALLGKGTTAGESPEY